MKDIIVHIPKVEQWDSVMKRLEKEGFKWASGRKPTEFNPMESQSSLPAPMQELLKGADCDISQESFCVSAEVERRVLKFCSREDSEKYDSDTPILSVKQFLAKKSFPKAKPSIEDLIIHIPEKKLWNSVMEKLEKLEVGVVWGSGNKPTEKCYWDEEEMKENACVNVGLTPPPGFEFLKSSVPENLLLYDEKSYFEKTFPSIPIIPAKEFLAEKFSISKKKASTGKKVALKKGKRTSASFKVGDKVKSIEGDEEGGVVSGVPGMPEYDAKPFISASEGFTLEDGRWRHRKDWEKVS